MCYGLNKIFFMILTFFVLCTSASCQSKSWYKGNTHVHTVICGHADTDPDTVVKWYHDRDYNFLILSEHNVFVDPATINFPADKRADFILIPGEEVTDRGTVHSTSMNIDKFIPLSDPATINTRAGVIQDHVDKTIAAGGSTILNHPNFQWAIVAEDILPVKNLYMFELYNGHPGVNSFGSPDHSSVETMWDKLLSAGYLIYAVASDDAHHFQTKHPDASTPGRGWIMVQASELTPDTITEAVRSGDFYASSGIHLSTIKKGPKVYKVAVDLEKTTAEIDKESSYARFMSTPEALHWGVDPNYKEGYKVEFFGQDGRLLSIHYGDSFSYKITGDEKYVRAKVTYSEKIDTGYVEYYAWTQPYFLDGRDKK